MKDCQFGVSPVNYSDSESETTKIMFWLMFETNSNFIELISRDQTPH